MLRVAWPSILFFTAAFLTSCGAENGKLESIRINRQPGAAAQFTATGIYSSGRQVTPLAVSWMTWDYATFVANQPNYRLTSSPYVPQCSGSGTGWTLAAFRPIDPSAPASGPIPASVLQDLVSGKASTESGFVATTLQVTCP